MKRILGTGPQYHSFVHQFGSFKSPRKLKRESVGGFTGRDIIDRGSLSDDQFAVDEIKYYLSAVMERLLPRERASIEMRFLRGLPRREVAKALRVTQGRLWQIEIRAIEKLYHLLKYRANDFGWLNRWRFLYD